MRQEVTRRLGNAAYRVLAAIGTRYNQCAKDRLHRCRTQHECGGIKFRHAFPTLPAGDNCSRQNDAKATKTFCIASHSPPWKDQTRQPRQRRTPASGQPLQPSATCRRTLLPSLSVPFYLYMTTLLPAVSSSRCCGRPTTPSARLPGASSS